LTLKPNKALGQSFLRDPETARRIAASLPTDLPVLEIGCGDGFLTEALLSAGHRVLGVEIDASWIPKLLRRIHHHPNFQLVATDALKIDWEALGRDQGRLQVAGNLPYHLASTILFDIFDRSREPDFSVTKVVTMVQREVAARLTAATDDDDYGSLTLLTRYHAESRFLFRVPATLFHPRPRVDGGVIELTLRNASALPNVAYYHFRRIVRGCFAQRRKMLRNAIRIVNDLPDGWEDLPFDYTRRAEQVSFEEYLDLTHKLVALGFKP